MSLIVIVCIASYHRHYTIQPIGIVLSEPIRIIHELVTEEKTVVVVSIFLGKQVSEEDA